MGLHCSLFLVGLIIEVVGLLAHICSFSTPYWIEFGDEDLGLWQACNEDGCRSFLTIEDILNGWFHAAQAATCCGTLIIIISFFVSVVYMKNQSRSLALAPGMLTFSAGILIGVGVAIFASKLWTKGARIGWALFTECGAVAVLLIAGVIFYIAGGRTRSKSAVVDFTDQRNVIGESKQPTTEL